MFILYSSLAFFRLILHISTLWRQYMTYNALDSRKPFFIIDDTNVLAGRLQFGFIFRIITSVCTLSLLYCKVYWLSFF